MLSNPFSHPISTSVPDCVSRITYMPSTSVVGSASPPTQTLEASNGQFAFGRSAVQVRAQSRGLYPDETLMEELG